MKIAALDDYLHVARESADWSRLDPIGDVTIFHDHIEAVDPLVERLEPFDTIILMRERTPITREIIERLPNLKLLVTAGMRNLAIDYDAAREHNITICGTYGDPTMVSELACGLILALTRNIPAEDLSVKTGGWQQKVGVSLANKRLGVVGLGRIGMRVAKFGKLFEMNVAAWSSNLTEERCTEVGVEKAASIDEMVAQSDIIAVTTVLSDRTHNLISRERIATLKPGAFIVNVSRGEIIDEEALVEALENNRIGGAGLDVYHTEPLPLDHKLRSLKNTVLTGHIGGFTDDTYHHFYTQCIDDIIAFEKGEPIRILDDLVLTYAEDQTSWKA